MLNTWIHGETPVLGYPGKAEEDWEWRRSLQRNVEGWFRPSYVGEHETPTSAEDENESPQTAGEQNNIEYRFASVPYAQPENDHKSGYDQGFLSSTVLQESS